MVFADSADMLEKGGKAGLINLYPISVHNIMRNTINSNTGVQLPVIFGTHQAQQDMLYLILSSGSPSYFNVARESRRV